MILMSTLWKTLYKPHEFERFVSSKHHFKSLWSALQDKRPRRFPNRLAKSGAYDTVKTHTSRR